MKLEVLLSIAKRGVASINDIHEDTGVPYRTLYVIMHRLAVKGKIIRIGYGKYMINEKYRDYYLSLYYLHKGETNILTVEKKKI